MELNEYWQSEVEHQQAEFLHRLEVQNGLGQGALKSMMLVNGGAVIALLTFIGNKATVTHVCSVKTAMGMYGAGLFFALFAYFFAYFSQADFMMVAAYRKSEAQLKSAGGGEVATPPIFAKRGSICLWSAIASLLLALILFGLGSAFALSGIL